MNHVYLSPHLDDGILSCGGAIHHHAMNGDSVLVITVFAGDAEPTAHLSSFALTQHRYWGNPPAPMALRRAEDAAALVLLGARGEHLDYLDAVYRVDAESRWLYVDEDALWGAVQPSDPLVGASTQAMADRIVLRMSPVDEPTIYAPLGVGNHIDHQIVYTTACHLVARGYRVAFYEDYPYAEKASALETVLKRVDCRDWQPESIALEASDVAAKVAALAYYRTQLGILFRGAELMPNRVWAFATARSSGAVFAERIWWPRGDLSHV